MIDTHAVHPPRSDDDDVVQSAVLWLLIDSHPTRLTIEEVQDQLIAATPGTTEERAAINEAIGELVGASLVEVDGTVVTTSPAIVRASELLQ